MERRELTQNQGIPKTAAPDLGSVPGITRITRENPDFLKKLGFAYLKELRSIVCISCRITVMSPSTDAGTCLSHYSNAHHYRVQPTKAKKDQFKLDFCSFADTHPVLTVGKETDGLLKTLPQNMERIPTLAVFENGWICAVDGCKAAWAPDCELKTRGNHINTIHNRAGSKHPITADSFKRGTVQHLGPHPKHYYFAVNPLFNGVDPESPWFKWSERFNADTEIEQKMFPHSVHDPNERAATDQFHSKTHWITHAEQYSVSDTRRLVALAGANDPMGKLNKVALRWIQGLPRERMDKIEPVLLQKLNHWKHFSKAFATVGAESESAYAILARRLAMFLIRVVLRAPGNDEPLATAGSAWDIVQETNKDLSSLDTPNGDDIADNMVAVEENFADEEGEAAEEEADDDFVGVADLRSSDDEHDDDDDDDDETCGAPPPADAGKPTYRVILTKHQSKAAQELWNALQQDSKDAELDKLFQRCLLAAFTDMDNTPQNRFHTPIEAFLFALHLRRDGSVKPALLVAPSLSKLQYAILFCILKKALACPDGLKK
ncbi:hypothetical protein DFH06DRAFT_69656 [Mycena polygramma]|nr:hypothetical protein DFH06DRAFT_69656 [Mycena polygramma]